MNVEFRKKGKETKGIVSLVYKQIECIWRKGQERADENAVDANRNNGKELKYSQ